MSVTFHGTYVDQGSFSSSGAHPPLTGTVAVTPQGGSTTTATLDASGSYSTTLPSFSGKVTVVETFTGLPAALTRHIWVVDNTTTDTSHDVEIPSAPGDIPSGTYIPTAGDAAVAGTKTFERLVVSNSDNTELTYAVYSDAALIFAIENNPITPVDVNFRNCNIVFGTPDSPGVGLVFRGEAYYIPLSVSAPGSQVTSWYVTAAGTMVSLVGGLSGTAWSVGVAGQGNPRFIVDEMGAMSWGPGSGTAVDTNLYRSAAGTLKTDHHLLASTLGIGTQHVGGATPTGGTSGDMKVGTGKIWVNDAGTWKSVAVA